MVSWRNYSTSQEGSINNVENYTGITSLSTLGKLFTRILNNRLTRWAENYSVYIETQAGIRETMSTTDHIFHYISHYLNNNNKKKKKKKKKINKYFALLLIFQKPLIM